MVPLMKTENKKLGPMEIIAIPLPNKQMLSSLSMAEVLQYTNIALLQCVLITSTKARKRHEPTVLRAPSEKFMEWIEEMAMRKSPGFKVLTNA